MRLALAAVLFALCACATDSRYPYHSFGFDLSSDGQDAVILDYRYGTSRQVAISASEAFKSAGKGYQAQSITQPMTPGEYVYLKWQSGKQVYEDTIDLRNRLPEDIDGHTIYLMVRGAQAYVYLITPDKRKKETPPIGPGAYADKQIVQLYPGAAPGTKK